MRQRLLIGLLLGGLGLLCAGIPGAPGAPAFRDILVDSLISIGN